jgi:hypothetical protein
MDGRKGKIHPFISSRSRFKKKKGATSSFLGINVSLGENSKPTKSPFIHLKTGNRNLEGVNILFDIIKPAGYYKSNY